VRCVRQGRQAPRTSRRHLQAGPQNLHGAAKEARPKRRALEVRRGRDDHADAGAPEDPGPARRNRETRRAAAPHESDRQARQDRHVVSFARCVNGRGVGRAPCVDRHAARPPSRREHAREEEMRREARWSSCRGCW
jgi:hypothetical protein